MTVSVCISVSPPTGPRGKVHANEVHANTVGVHANEVNGIDIIVHANEVTVSANEVHANASMLMTCSRQAETLLCWRSSLLSLSSAYPAESVITAQGDAETRTRSLMAILS